MPLNPEEATLLEDLKDKMIQNPSYYPLLKNCSKTAYGDIPSGKTRRSKPAIWSKLIVAPEAPLPASPLAGSVPASPLASSAAARVSGAASSAGAGLRGALARIRGQRTATVAPATSGGSRRNTKKNKKNKH
jgi:hypothetical protein